MSLTATYDQPNAVVELTVTGLATAGAAIATIERATDPAGPWTPVRGAINMAVTGNGPDTYLDYEFTAGPGVTNYYRVIGQDPIEFVGVGSAWSDEGNGYDLVPSFHGSTQVGDIVVLFVVQSGGVGVASIQPPGGSGTWVLIGKSTGSGGADDLPLRTAIYMSTVFPTQTGVPIAVSGASGDSSSAIAQVATFRNARMVSLGADEAVQADQPATTNQIEFPALSVVEDFALSLIFGGSAEVWTSAAVPSPFTSISSPTFNGVTDDASLAWGYDVRQTAGTVSSGVFTITGGTHNADDKRGWTAAIGYDSDNAPSSVLFSDDVDTPLAVVWLKDPLRPARNMIVEVASPTGMRFSSRSGLFDIKGRAEPIEVSEIRRTRSWVQRWVARTFAELDALHELFAPGRTLLLQVPARGTLPDCPPWPRNLPGGYISVGDVSEDTAPDASIPATLTAPVQIVAAPCADLAICEPVEDSP